mgnify:CR=1 FL=1
MVLEVARLEAFVPHWTGRPPAEWAARAFVAKAVLDSDATNRVQADKPPRLLGRRRDH